ncbi:hypothetical protein SKAU_G00025220 [Synaphobranchus kaupii]|uniref:Golgin B1 n=1 Tax=Synaphobranchus kaupii TaxID=118154 RepID=A0A9Q1GDY8_SYNKA|nr:hypothetical protein SKAU_G00025220 [Synaphobranchus kaupii]
MFSRLAQGVNSVLQELSGEESNEGSVPSQDVVAPEAPAEAPEAEEDTLERLAQTEQLVVQLKEMVREKEGQLTSTQRQLKEEKEAGDVRLTKLKLQAKARVAALNKQIADLKGHGMANSTQSPDSSLTMAPGMEEELQQLKLRLQEEESVSRTLREQLEASEQLLQEKEAGHAEQVRVLQAVVCEKDVRFKEQIQKHEEELLKVTTQAQDDTELQQALGAAQRRTEELEMLQQELNSADEQKQILTSQFRQMEQELAEARRQVEQELTEVRRQVEEEREQWVLEAGSAKAELATLRERLEAAEELAALRERLEAADREKEEVVKSLEVEAEERAGELTALRERLRAAERERNDGEQQEGEVVARMEAEMATLRGRLEAVEREREEGAQSEGETMARMEAELAALRDRLETEGEQQRAAETMAELWKGLRALAGGEADAGGGVGGALCPE